MCAFPLKFLESASEESRTGRRIDSPVSVQPTGPPAISPSEKLAALFNERDDAVKWMCRHLIEVAHQAGAKVGICGQAPSDYPDFAAFLVEQGIDSISLNPDSVIEVKQRVAEVEQQPAEAVP